MTQSSAPSRLVIARQIRLPLRRAVEIAWKSLRVRLARSLLVTSGIVLALAFLMTTLVTQSTIDGLRQWSTSGPAAQSLQRQELESLLIANGIPLTPRDIADSRTQSRWVVGIALMVAFVGILNAMLMSVTERFREIGTMKCLGALDGFIVKLFVLESLFQGVVGTVLGVLLGGVFSLLSSRITFGALVWHGVHASELLSAGALTLVVGIALSVAGAAYPAWHASHMQPIEAMRVDT
jgi:hypothetical protein